MIETNRTAPTTVRQLRPTTFDQPAGSAAHAQTPVELQNVAGDLTSGSGSEDNGVYVDPGQSAGVPTESPGCCGLSRSKKAIVVTFCLSNFFVGAFYSILGPFYPKRAKEKGMEESEIGMVFGIYELVLVIASPLIGKYLTILGSKFVFIAGLMCCGYCSILFGFVDDIQGKLAVYSLFSFLLRAVEGVSAAGINTASFAMVAHTFPDSIGVIFGTLEAFSGFGMMIGPPLGGALFQLGGFRLPFFTTGALLIILGVATIFTLPSHNDIPSLSGSATVFGLLRMPTVAITGILVVAGSAAIGFTNVVLSLILEESYGLTVGLTSLTYLIGPAIYMISAPIWGAVADKKPGFAVELVVIGYIIGGIAFWFMGPSPFLQIPGHLLWLLLLTQAFLGLGIAAFVITFKLIPEAARSKYGESLETFSIVSGLCNGFLSMGAFAGPIVGGVLYHKVGFPWATNIMGCLVLLSAVILFSYNRTSRCCGRSYLPLSEEGRPLLAN